MNKYRAVKTVVDGITFDSKAEARRYSQLRLLELGKQITDMKRQVIFALYGKNGSPVGRYKVDFTYLENGKHVAEDVKGFKVRDMPTRIKLFNDNYPEWELRMVAA